MAKAKRDWSKTWFGVCLQRVGFKKTCKVMEFALSWAIVTGDLERPPHNIEEYSAWWGQGIATGYREQAVWREAFPEYSTPTEWFEVVGLDPVGAPENAVHGIFTVDRAVVT